MTKTSQKTALARRVETPGLRILVVTVSAPTELREVTLASRVHKLVELYLEKHWSGGAQRALALRSLTYALMDDVAAPEFAYRVDQLAERLQRHLVGDANMVDGTGVAVDVFAPGRTAAPGRGKQAPARANTPRTQPATTPPASPPPAQTPAPDHAARPQTITPTPPKTAPRRRRGQPLASRIGYLPVLAGERGMFVFNDVVFRHPVRAKESLHPGPVGRSLRSDEEITLLQLAAHHAAQCSTDEKPTLVLCPISFATLAEPTMKVAILAALRSLNQTYGPVLALRIMETPPNVTESQIGAVTDGLRDRVKFIDWVWSGTPGPDLDVLTACGVQVVSLSMPPSEPERSAQLSQFTQLRSAMRAQRLQSSIFGLNTDSEMRRALASGVTYASGRVVARMVDAPTAPCPMSTTWSFGR